MAPAETNVVASCVGYVPPSGGGRCSAPAVYTLTVVVRHGTRYVRGSCSRHLGAAVRRHVGYKVDVHVSEGAPT